MEKSILNIILKISIILLLYNCRVLCENTEDKLTNLTSLEEIGSLQKLINM